MIQTVRQYSFPWAVLLTAIIACVMQLFPVWRDDLLFDRTAIGNGEVWRAWTGHLVHFGWPHFVVDTGLLVILGWLVEREHPWFTRLGLIIMPLFISFSVYHFEPDIQIYGGLSAVNLGILLYAAFSGWRKNWTDWFWPAVVLAYVGELTFEHFSGGHGGGTIKFDDPTVRVATGAHLASAAYALVAFAISRGFKSSFRSVGQPKKS